MKNTIGFSIGNEKDNNDLIQTDNNAVCVVARRSLVQVYFEKINRSYTYFNDMFDLKNGDVVYVDGKLCGMRGVVTSVNYSFKIKRSEYQKVIRVVSNDVKGEIFFGGQYLYSFDRETIPYKTVKGWFMMPDEDEEYETGTDDISFPIDDLSQMDLSRDEAETGHHYYTRECVAYLCIENGKGKAIVVGSKPYEVEFEFKNGSISNLVCSCYCCNHCRHSFAAMLQLRECLDKTETDYFDCYKDYFAVVSKNAFVEYVVFSKVGGKIHIG